MAMPPTCGVAAYRGGAAAAPENTLAAFRCAVAEGAAMLECDLRGAARVDAGLRRLPELEATFVGGGIPWTKARLVAGVAAPEDEGVWLEAAARLSSDALAREVWAVDARAVALAAPGPAS